MKKFNADRMLKLADHLETVPRKAFDMGVFGEKSECGTVACAMGHACDIPAFKKIGVKGTWEKFHEYDYNYSTGETKLIPKQQLRVHMRDNTDIDGFVVAETIFDITNDEAYELFGEHNEGKTPKQVAKELRKFVRSKGF